MKKTATNATITVRGTEVAVIQREGQDYISLTDMLKAKDGDFLISDWLRNRAFETLDALEDTLVSALRNLELNPEAVQSICQSDWIVNPISIAN